MLHFFIQYIVRLQIEYQYLSTAGLLINSDKTKVMVSGTNEINRPTKISLSGKDLEEVESFVYLGSIFTRDVSCSNDIRKTLAIGRSVMQSLSSIWRSKDISTTTKIRLLKALVWSVAIYGCEGWTLYSRDQKCIDAFEMWCYRRLLRIPWTQHKTNEWILGELDVERELLGRVKSLKLGHYGHVTRKYENMEKELIQGCAPGNRSRGRQRRRWTDDIIEWTGLTITEAARLTEDRDHWRGILRAANPLSGGRH